MKASSGCLDIFLSGASPVKTVANYIIFTNLTAIEPFSGHELKPCGNIFRCVQHKGDLSYN